MHGWGGEHEALLETFSPTRAPSPRDLAPPGATFVGPRPQGGMGQCGCSCFSPKIRGAGAAGMGAPQLPALPLCETTAPEPKSHLAARSPPPLCRSMAPTGHREAPPRPDPLPVTPVRNRVPMGAPGTPWAKSNPRAEVTAGRQTGATLQQVPVPRTEPFAGRELREPPRSELRFLSLHGFLLGPAREQRFLQHFLRSLSLQPARGQAP